MIRKLSALEIAEGALLADIAVVFHLLMIYLPVGGGFFALLMPALFSILVLRRSLLAGIMGLCVAVFISGMITGFHSIFLMLLICGSGLFLGLTMKYRLHYLPLILIGTLGSAVVLFCSTLLTILLLGQPFIDTLLQGIRNGYVVLFSLTGLIAPLLGLANWWHNAYPVARHLADLTLTYWLVLVFVSGLFFAFPAVIIVYYITTFLVRLLGYDVRPFPDGWINKLIRWFTRILIKLALKSGLGKYWIARALIKEIRRRNIGLGRQKSN